MYFYSFLMFFFPSVGCWGEDLLEQKKKPISRSASALLHWADTSIPGESTPTHIPKRIFINIVLVLEISLALTRPYPPQGWGEKQSQCLGILEKYLLSISVMSQEAHFPQISKNLTIF